MNDDQREQVRSNAKYLRNVRPVDPDEICEYVSGRPHPAAVRQVLRESAVDIGLCERPDGTFVPASDEPIDPDFDGVEALPEAYVRHVEDLLVERFGPGWPEGESGETLRWRIREIKERYLEQRDVRYDAVTALGYAIYHLPAYYAAVQYVLGDLATDGLVSGTFRVLDVGAGVGGPALGLHDLAFGGPGDHGSGPLIDYHAVEPSEAADVLDSLLEETCHNFHATIHRTPAEDFQPGEYDLILFANVLSELTEPVAVVERYLDALSSDGSLVALAPADRNTATQLRRVERAVADDDGVTVYAPTVRLWPHETPTSECWSFDVKPPIEVPAFQRRLDEAATGADHESGDGVDHEPGDGVDHEPGEFVNVDVQYAYSVLRRDGRRSVDLRPDRGAVAKLAESESFVTERVDLLVLKLSHDLADGEHPVYLVGDGSEAVDHFAVLTQETELNADLRRADYGDPLSLSNALVLWNDDEGAYNVVVDGETIVDRVPA